MNEPTAATRPFPRLLKRRLLICGLLSGVVGLACFWLFSAKQVEVPAPRLAGAYADVAAAIEDARQLVEQSPRTGAVWGNYGMVLAAHEYTPESIACFREAVRLSPQEMKWWYFLGDLHEFSDRQFAIECFQKARLLSERAKPLVNTRLAEIMIAAGKMAEAKSLLMEALPSDSANDRVRLSLARIALAEKQPEAALEHLQSAAKQYRVKSILELSANVHRLLGDATRENEALQAATSAKVGGWPDALLMEIQHCRVDPHWVAFKATTEIESATDSNQVEDSIVTLQRLVTKYPTETTFRIELVRQLMFLKRYQRAEELLASSSGGADSFDLLSLRGTLSLLQEDWKSAIDAFEKAALLKPASAATKRDLGFAYEQSGQLDKALVAVSQAARLDVSKAEFLTARIQLLQNLGRTGEADEAIAQFKERFGKVDGR